MMTELEKQIYIAKQINRAVQLTLLETELEDEKAMEVADLYPAWEPGKTYTTGMILRYGVNADGETQLYRVVQDHTSQGNWLPDETASLYKKIGFEGEIPIWTQPYGASDAYAKGDRVSHKEIIWESDIDGNVWEPGIYGWTEVAP